jgi:hypothetical protein
MINRLAIKKALSASTLWSYATTRMCLPVMAGRCYDRHHDEVRHVDAGEPARGSVEENGQTISALDKHRRFTIGGCSLWLWRLLV